MGGIVDPGDGKTDGIAVEIVSGRFFGGIECRVGATTIARNRRRVVSVGNVDRDRLGFGGSATVADCESLLASRVSSVCTDVQSVAGPSRLIGVASKVMRCSRTYEKKPDKINSSECNRRQDSTL